MRFRIAAFLLALSAPACLAQNAGRIAPSSPDPSFDGSINFLADVPSAPTKIPKTPVLFDLSAIDKTADPCTDFYQYSCGNWVKSNQIPNDRTGVSRFSELADHNNYLLYSELRTAADAPKTPLQKKYGDYFASCMDTERINALGAKPLQPELDSIAALKDPKELAAFNARQDRRGGGAFFGVAVTQRSSIS